jgi:hypothetical protein
VKQLAAIERRVARLRRIRNRLSKENRLEAVPKTLKEHHHIGRSRNRFVHIPSFLRERAGDPAIKVYSLPEKCPFINNVLAIRTSCPI